MRRRTSLACGYRSGIGFAPPCRRAVLLECCNRRADKCYMRRVPRSSGSAWVALLGVAVGLVAISWSMPWLVIHPEDFIRQIGGRLTDDSSEFYVEIPFHFQTWSAEWFSYDLPRYVHGALIAGCVLAVGARGPDPDRRLGALLVCASAGFALIAVWLAYVAFASGADLRKGAWLATVGSVLVMLAAYRIARLST